VSTDFTYDVALSFAGEDRAYVAQVAELLQAGQVRVFYDEYEKVTLWGKDLYTHLREVYQKHARYTVLFASAHYRSKVWTNLERESAQARAISERTEYILPARFDDSEIPGLLPTTGYVDLRSTSPKEFTDLILAKLGRRPPSWVETSRPSMPGEPPDTVNSLQAMAARLSAASSSRERRARILASAQGVALARKEATALFGIIAAEVASFRALDSSVEIEAGRTGQGVIFVSTWRASLTMFLQLQYSNTLDGSLLWIQEFDSIYRPEGRRKEADRTGEWYFELDEADSPRWRPKSSGVPLTTRQLAERYLSWLIARVFAEPDK